MSRTKQAAVGAGVALATAGGIAAVAAIRAHRAARVETPGRTLTGSLELAPTAETTVRTEDGVTLHVDLDEPATPLPGAPTVVLVHGFSISRRGWVLQRRALREAGYRVVTYDHRGHGRSGVGDPEHARVSQLGRDLRRVLDEVVPEGPIVLVGHSMGGMAMMSLGETSPDLIGERVVAAVFVATSAGGEGKLISLGYGALVGRLITTYGPGALTRLSRQERFVRSFRRLGRDIEDYVVYHYSFSSRVSQTLLRFTGDLAFETSFASMAGFISTFHEHDLRDSLQVWGKVPTLVLTAQNDRLTPADHGELVASSIPGSEHVLVENAGHMVMLEHADLVNRELLEFLGKVSE